MTDPDILAAMTVNGKVPKLAIVVDVKEAFLHCAKAFRRSHLWDPARFIDRLAELGYKAYPFEPVRAEALIAPPARLLGLPPPYDSGSPAAPAAAAALLMLSEPLTAAQIAAGMKSFPGLAHRMEELGRQGRTLLDRKAHV